MGDIDIIHYATAREELSKNQNAMKELENIGKSVVGQRGKSGFVEMIR